MLKKLFILVSAYLIILIISTLTALMGDKLFNLSPNVILMVSVVFLTNIVLIIYISYVSARLKMLEVNYIDYRKQVVRRIGVIEEDEPSLADKLRAVLAPKEKDK